MSRERVRGPGVLGVRDRRPQVWAAVVAAAAASALMARPAAGDPIGRSVVDLDLDRSTVTFSLAGSLHDTEGSVPLTAGRLEVDPDAGTATGLVVADARATTTGNSVRDATMRDEVLETGRFPEIRFRPTGVDAGALNADGTLSGTLRGVLTLHGSEHELDVPVHGHLVGDEVTATCRFTIPYVAWGLHDPSVLVLTVAKTVDVEVRAIGRLSRPSPTR